MEKDPIKDVNIIQCKNCGNEFNGNFCNQCGQKQSVNRINFSHLVEEITNSIFQLERGLVYTAKELMLRPGATIRAYLSGKRQSFYKPLSYFLICSALYVITVKLFDRNTYIGEFIQGTKDSIAQSKELTVSPIFDLLLHNQTYLSLFFIPLYTLASYLSFLKSKYNFFEHLVLNLYISGHQSLFYLGISFFIKDESDLITIPILVSLVYKAWVYYQFFNTNSKLSNTFRITLMYILFSIEFIALFIIGVLTIVHIYDL